MVKLEYADKEEQLNFEKVFCATKTITWINKAWDLRNSSEALYQIQLTQIMEIFNDGKAILKEFSVLHSSSIQRMLWGYSFENLA